jgi:hypothetical protein
MNFTEQLEKIKEQEWFQQLKNSYNQLSLEQQNYVKWGSLASGVFLLLYLTFNTIESANSVKNEYFEKQELAQMITSANDEIRRIKGQTSGFTQTMAQSWGATLESLVTAQGLGADVVEIVKEAPGATQSIIQETLLQLKVKGLAIRPLIQLLYQIEHGSPPMKIKGMLIEPSATDGLLNSRLNVSGSMAMPEKGESKK